MTKRGAMLMAAGVVLALLGGSVALSFGLSGGNTASADPPGPPEKVVRTVHRTIRVERQAKDQPVEVVTVATGSGAVAPATTAVAGIAEDDAEESEDENHEGDALDGDDHGSEDGGDHVGDGGWDDD